jgi:hypothetical protein
MKAEAWAAISEGLSSYAAIASAYFFARPALRLQGKRAAIELLEEAERHPDEEVVQFVRELRKTAHEDLTRSLGHELRWNAMGLALLVLSAALLAIAVCIHAFSE